MTTTPTIHRDAVRATFTPFDHYLYDAYHTARFRAMDAAAAVKAAEEALKRARAALRAAERESQLADRAFNASPRGREFWHAVSLDCQVRKEPAAA